MSDINKNLLEAVEIISSLPKFLSDFAEKGTQESLDVLTSKIAEMDEKINFAKASIATTIKSVVGDDEEVEVKETENGMEV